MKDYLKEVLDYCDRHNIEYTINSNPTQEEIERIKRKLKRSEELKTLFQEHGTVAKLVKASD